MIIVNEDLSICLTRGDAVAFSVSAEHNNEDYTFQAGDVVRFKVFEKKNCEGLMLQKDFYVTETTTEVQISLDEHETRIGETINKAKDYWYEVELISGDNTQTIIGFDEDGAKIFKLYPEGKELDVYIPTKEDIPYVDAELNLSSPRPVQNQAVARAVTRLHGLVSENEKAIENVDTKVSGIKQEVAVERARINALAKLAEGSTTGDAELQDIRVGANGFTYTSAGESVREQLGSLTLGVGTKETFLDNQLRTINLCKESEATFGYYKDASGVNTVVAPNYGYTNFIPTRKGDKFVACHSYGSQASVLCYNAAKELVSAKYWNQVTPLKAISGELGSLTINDIFWFTWENTGSNIAYVVFNFCINSVTESPKLGMMVCYGSSVDDIPTEYIEYKLEIKGTAFKAQVKEIALNAVNDAVTKDEKNTVLGSNAMPVKDGVEDNVAIGSNALASIDVDLEEDSQSGKYNVAVGKNAMRDTTLGNHNTAVGYQAMRGDKKGSCNTAVGEDALMVVEDGHYNVAIGCRAMQSAKGGNGNVAIGQGAMYWSDSEHPNGNRNVAIGQGAGQTDGSGSENTQIGYWAKANNGLNNCIVIGSNAKATKDNQAVIGSLGTVETLLNGNLVVRGTDGSKREIIFNADGTCSWHYVE